MGKFGGWDKSDVSTCRPIKGAEHARVSVVSSPEKDQIGRLFISTFF